MQKKRSRARFHSRNGQQIGVRRSQESRSSIRNDQFLKIGRSTVMDTFVSEDTGFEVDLLKYRELVKFV